MSLHSSTRFGTRTDATIGALNVVGRLGWVYSLYPEGAGRFRVWSGFVAAGAEVARRGVWAILR